MLLHKLVVKATNGYGMVTITWYRTIVVGIESLPTMAPWYRLHHSATPQRHTTAPQRTPQRHTTGQVRSSFPHLHAADCFRLATASIFGYPGGHCLPKLFPVGIFLTNTLKEALPQELSPPLAK
jgi:hypothetical protein